MGRGSAGRTQGSGVVAGMGAGALVPLTGVLVGGDWWEAAAGVVCRAGGRGLAPAVVVRGWVRADQGLQKRLELQGERWGCLAALARVWVPAMEARVWTGAAEGFGVLGNQVLRAALALGALVFVGWEAGGTPRRVGTGAGLSGVRCRGPGEAAGVCGAVGGREGHPMTVGRRGTAERKMVALEAVGRCQRGGGVDVKRMGV